MADGHRIARHGDGGIGDDHGGAERRCARRHLFQQDLRRAAALQPGRDVLDDDVDRARRAAPLPTTMMDLAAHAS